VTRLERFVVWIATAIVFVTGVVYAIMKHLMSPADEWAIVNHPLQPWVLKLHILAAPVLVFALGLIAARHIVPRLRLIPGRRFSGSLSAWTVLLLVASGYLIQAVTHAPTVTFLGWTHLGLGVVYGAAAARHALIARRRDRASQRTETSVPGRPAAYRASA
jgi:hypothetical protein